MLSTSINIHGKSVPLSVFKALTDLAPTIFEGIENGKSAKEIVASVEQEAGTAALAVVESVVNIFFPGAGTAIEVIEFILKHRVAQTQEEVNAFMDRFGIGEG